VSEQNVQLVRAIYEAWANGASARDLIDEDVEYVNPPDAVEPGTLRGRKSFARVRDAYPEFVVEPERYVDVGDDVVVIAVARGRGASGLETQWKQGYVWTVRHGRAVRFRWFNDPRRALDAVGLEQ
jgi:ketosteroid isomerase-like protein